MLDAEGRAGGLASCVLALVLGIDRTKESLPRPMTGCGGRSWKKFSQVSAHFLYRDTIGI